MGNDARHLLYSSGSTIDIRPSQLGCEQMTSTENVKWKVAITAIVSVKETALLLAVHRIIGAIKIKNNLVRHLILRF